MTGADVPTRRSSTRRSAPATRTTSRSRAPRRASTAEAPLRARADRPHRGAGCSSRSTSEPTTSTAGSRSGRPPSGGRRGGDDRAGPGLHRPRRLQRLHQDPRHRGGAKRLRSRSSRASRSTSRCSSRPTSTWARPRRTCGPRRGSRRGSTRRFPRSRRSSSAAGTSPWRTRCPLSSERARDRGGDADLSGLSGAARLRALAAPRQRGRPSQRLLWASTGAKDPDAPDALRRGAGRPLHRQHDARQTLLAFSEDGEMGEPLPADGGDAEQVLAEFGAAGVDVADLAARLQREGAEAFDASWSELMESIEAKSPQARGVGVGGRGPGRAVRRVPGMGRPGAPSRRDRRGSLSSPSSSPAIRRAARAWRPRPPVSIP